MFLRGPSIHRMSTARITSSDMASAAALSTSCSGSVCSLSLVGRADGGQMECGFRVTVAVAYPAAQAAGSVARPQVQGQEQHSLGRCRYGGVGEVGADKVASLSL